VTTNTSKKGRKQNTIQLNISIKGVSKIKLKISMNAFYQRTGIAANQ
jgi:hypothetical protein